MKLGTFEISTPLGTFRRIYAHTDEGLVDLNAAYRALLTSQGRLRAAERAQALVPPDMLGLLEAGADGMEAAAAALDFVLTRGERTGPNGGRLVFDPDEVKILACLPRPRTLRDFLAFEQHMRDGRARRGHQDVPPLWYEIPIYYKGNPNAIIGPDETAFYPAEETRMDYELEFAIVIGKEGRNISRSEASSYIAGYTILNDFSARDVQMREMQLLLGPARGKDFCSALGPWLVTPDEVGDPYNLVMEARVNGELWSRGNSGTIHHKFEDMIAYVSQSETLYPGDVFGSGTVGKGCGADLGRFLSVGDVVELSIEKLGVLRNPVAKQGA